MKKTLTKRHQEVVRLLSLGCTTGQAAKILGLSPSTVDNHKTAAMTRLGVDKLALLTRVAIQTGVSGVILTAAAPAFQAVDSWAGEESIPTQTKAAAQIDSRSRLIIGNSMKWPKMSPGTEVPHGGRLSEAVLNGLGGPFYVILCRAGIMREH